MTGQKRPLAKTVEKQYSHDSYEWLNSNPASASASVNTTVMTLVNGFMQLSGFHFQYRHRRVIPISGARSNPSQEGEGVILVKDIVLVTAEQRCMWS